MTSEGGSATDEIFISLSEEEEEDEDGASKMVRNSYDYASIKNDHKSMERC